MDKANTDNATTAGHVSRRQVLGAAAFAGAASVLAGCGSGGDGGASDGQQGDAATGKGSELKPLAKPSSFTEAPMLAALVKEGKLPPLEERLPQNPFVIPHRWVKRGKFGGGIKMTLAQSADWAAYQYWYGPAFVRFQNDGLDIGPGLAESFEMSADAREWTFNFRKGLKWSDGKDWTTDDIMYWWDDLVTNEQHPSSPPDSTRDGKDNVAKVTAPDKYTLKLTFNEPAPATLERICADSRNQTLWMQPKHYASQFHPKYNKQIKGDDANWVARHEQKVLWNMNPDCPSMNGFRVSAFKDGQTTLMERNPYYYCVTKEGDQLPYPDHIQWLVTTDPQVRNLQIASGKFDYVHCAHTAITLADFQSLKASESSGKNIVHTWDSGSGTGSITFFNFDNPEENYRKLLADKNFRMALSHAFNRPEAKKTLYFEQGDLTSGTLSPKGKTHVVNEEAKQVYQQWRDAWLEYDVDKAKQLLDEAGVKDTDGDGFREFPDGGKITLQLDYPADTSQEHIAKSQQLKRDWEAVGIAVRILPSAPTTFGDRWGRGDMFAHAAWEVGDCQPLLYAGWVVFVAPDHWAPLHGTAYSMKLSAPDTLTSKSQLDKPPWKRDPPFAVAADDLPLSPVFTKLQGLLDQARVETDTTKQMSLLWDIYKVHIDEGPFFYGSSTTTHGRWCSTRICATFRGARTSR